MDMPRGPSKVLVSETGRRDGLMPQLADTAAVALPASGRKPTVPASCSAAHMHEIRGLRLARGLGVFDVGVRAFDAPFSPVVL